MTSLQRVRKHSARGRVTASSASRRGMSLLEVFVALSIFIAALAVVSQIISTGSRAAIRAEMQSEATLRAESTMAEAVAGIIPLEADKRPFDDDPSWTWALAVESGPHVDTIQLVVTVEHTSEADRLNGVAVLRRIIRDPQLFLNAAASSSSSALDLLQ